MDRLISCEFNMDTACVELKFFDGSKIALYVLHNAAPHHDDGKHGS